MDNNVIKLNHNTSFTDKYEEYRKAYEDYEMEYWCNKFSVSREVLKQAIAKVGVSATAVEQYIKKVLSR